MTYFSSFLSFFTFTGSSPKSFETGRVFKEALEDN